MFGFCADPASLEGSRWLACYLTTPKHMAFYVSFGTVLLLLALAAPLALAFGFAGAFAKRAGFAPVRWLGTGYVAMVRGVPDIVFFLFVPIAMDQGLEWMRHKILCPEVTEPIRRGNDFVVCQAAKLPLGEAPQWVHDAYGFTLALIAYAVVFGAFAANVLDGALRAVPKGQIEAGAAIGLSPGRITRRIVLPQMWVYALPGLSNLWMILIKATPLLFLLGVEDVVYWARELGGLKTQAYDYPHPDWRAWYFAGLLVFYLFLTWISQAGFDRLIVRVSRGMPNAGAGSGAAA
ncbi:MAG: ABC transporter permease subunit [Pseudomonadota bacterium]